MVLQSGSDAVFDFLHGEFILQLKHNGPIALIAEGIAIPPESLVFAAETMWNYELGIKGSWLEDKLTLSAALFLQDRDDMQVKQSIVVPVDSSSPACPCVFIDSLQNAAGGRNSGLEFQGAGQVAARHPKRCL